MSKMFNYLAACIVILIVFAIFIYPTPFHYHEIVLNGDKYPIKENWITGHTWIYQNNQGWVVDDQ